VNNFVNWNSAATYGFTVYCLLLATLWVIFPYKLSCVWLFRAIVWLLFGPWNKLWDVLWIRKYYRTRDQLFQDGVPASTNEMKQDIANRPNILLLLLTGEFVGQLAESGRIVVENNVKLKDFREMMYGSFSEAIPSVDTTRFPSIPLPSSFAKPYCRSRDLNTEGGSEDDTFISWTYIPGQKLSGTMIPEGQ
jgi:hypothetical protein